MRKWIESRSKTRRRRRRGGGGRRGGGRGGGRRRKEKRRRRKREIRKIFRFMSPSYVHFWFNWKSYFLFGRSQVQIRRPVISTEVPQAVPHSTQVITLLAPQISPHFPYISFLGSLLSDYPTTLHARLANYSILYKNDLKGPLCINTCGRTAPLMTIPLRCLLLCTNGAMNQVRPIPKLQLPTWNFCSVCVAWILNTSVSVTSWLLPFDLDEIWATRNSESKGT